MHLATAVQFTLNHVHKLFPLLHLLNQAAGVQECSKVYLVYQAAGVPAAAALSHPDHSAACHTRAFHQVITVLLGW